MKKVLYGLLAFFLIFALSSCGADTTPAETETPPQERILGSWMALDDFTNEIVFYDDGTCAVGTNGSYENFSWSINSDTIKVVDHYGQAELSNYEFGEHTLTLTTEDGISAKFFDPEAEVEFDTSEDGLAALAERLEGTSLFSETLQSMGEDYEYTRDGVYPLTAQDPGGQAIHKVILNYTVTAKTEYPCVSMSKEYSVDFEYVVDADDFSKPGKVLIDSAEIWNIEGTWVYEDPFDSLGFRTETPQRIVELAVSDFEGGELTAGFTCREMNGNILNGVEPASYAVSPYSGEQFDYWVEIGSRKFGINKDGISINEGHASLKWVPMTQK